MISLRISTFKVHHGAAQTEAKGELLSVSVTYEQIRATLKAMLVYYVY